MSEVDVDVYDRYDDKNLERRSTFFTQRSFVDFRRGKEIVKKCLAELNNEQNNALDYMAIE